MNENKETRIAHEYHESTKHSEISLRNSTHSLDFGNKPRPFKTYTSLPKIELPREFPSPALNALCALSLVWHEEEQKAWSGDETQSMSSSLTPQVLAEILFFSAGITREMTHPGGKYYMRAAPATGALYPIELYLVCNDLPNIEAGVYHFDPAEFSLARIREGEFGEVLANATAYNEEIAHATVTVIFTSLVWRNAWKYEARSYRHWFWDSGVIAANLLACTTSLGVRASLVLGFEDEKISRLLSLEDNKEASVALVPLVSHVSEQRVSEERKLDVQQMIPSVKSEYVPLSQSEVDYPIIWKMNRASALVNQVEVSDWLRSASSIPRRSSNPARRRSYSLEPDHPHVDDEPPLGEVILKRGSTRRFSPAAEISFKQLSNLLYHSTRGIKADFLPESNSSLIDVYLISNAVQGLPSGSYFFNRERNSVELLKDGAFRNLSAYLCLEQPLFGQASVVFFLMAQLDPVLGYLGNRGYRAAQLEAGVMAGKIYLSAYSQGIGASGSTFYDDAVTEFLSPHAEEKSTMIALGVGVPAYRSRPGKVVFLGR